MKLLPELKLAIIGCGRISYHYLKLFEDDELLQKFKVVACMDIVPERAINLAKDFRAKPFSDLSVLINLEEIDLYIVATPSGTHFEVCKLLLENQKNVLVEKPSTLLIKDSEILVEIALKNNLFLGCIHQNRFNKAIIEAHNLLEQKMLGEITHFSVRLRWSRDQEYYNDGWHGKWIMDGGVIAQQAYHHLDVLLFLLGDFKSVFSIGDKRKHYLEADDTSVANFIMQSGALGTFEATTTILNRDLEASIEIFGSEGYIKIGGIGLNEIQELESTLCPVNFRRKLLNVKTKIDSGYGIGHKALINDVISSINSSKKSYKVTWGDSVKTLKLIHSIYASQELRREVLATENLTSSRLGV